MNKFLDYTRNYKIQFVCVCACFKVWYKYDDIAAKINLIWLVCDFRREVVLVAKLKHHAMNSKIHSHAQQESKSSVKEKSSRITSLYLFGTCWELINLDVIGFFFSFFFLVEKRCN